MAGKKFRIQLNPKELVLMSNLYINKDFPHNFLSLEEAAKILMVSKATAISVAKGLEEKGCIVKIRGYITFYRPVGDDRIRRFVLSRLGFF